MTYKDEEGQKYIFLNGVFEKTDVDELTNKGWRIFDCEKIINKDNNNEEKKKVMVEAESFEA